MAFLIGTAGHVDHGKTTLIQALTGIDTDRLPEEKERGMSIDVGFAYIDLDGIGRVSIVDVPGHEKLVHNMLVGAMGVDVGILVVAADDGVMPQTREHFAIFNLLEIKKLIVAITKIDRVDEVGRQLAKEDIDELIAPTPYAKAVTICVSATTGEGIDALRDAIREALSDLNVRANDLPWYLPIDRVFTIKGHGTVVTGTLSRQAVSVGESAFIEPGHIPVRVRSIQVHGEDADTAQPGQRTAMNLSGVRPEDIERGMAVGAPGAIFETDLMQIDAKWLVPVKSGQRVRISIGAAEAIGRLRLREDAVSVRLEHPIAVALHQPIIVRRYSPPDLLGGGTVLVPQAHSGAVVPNQLNQPIDLQVLDTIGESTDGIETETICRRLGRTPQQLGDVFESLLQNGRLLGFAGRWFRPEGFESGVARLMTALLELHHASPEKAWQPRDKVLAAANLRWSGKPLDRIMSALGNRQSLIVEGTNLRHPEFRVQLATRQRQFLDRVLSEYQDDQPNVPSAHQLAKALTVPPQAVEEILKLGVQAGELVRLEEDIYYKPSQLKQMVEKLRSTYADRPFQAAEARDLFQSSRRFIIPILEYFDAKGITVRTGNDRRLRTNRNEP